MVQYGTKALGHQSGYRQKLKSIMPLKNFELTGLPLTIGYDAPLVESRHAHIKCSNFDDYFQLYSHKRYFTFFPPHWLIYDLISSILLESI